MFLDVASSLAGQGGAGGGPAQAVLGQGRQSSAVPKPLGDKMRGKLAQQALGREQWQLGPLEDVPPTSAAVPQLILAHVALQALLQQENQPCPPAAQRGCYSPVTQT